MNLQQQIFSVLLGMVILITSCAKDGDTGPQGPAGLNGNANIKSFQFTVAPGDWQIYGSPGTPSHSLFYEEPISEITSEIMSSGMVTCYIVSAGYNVALPLVLPVNSSVFANFYYAFTVGTLEVDVNWSDLTTPNFGGNYDFRVVVADGTLRAMNPDLNWKDYYAVSKRFNLESE
jgi:hypothetical protein